MKKSDKRFRRFDVQRNYQFETHDKNGNQTSDITESNWRVKVISEMRSLFDSGVVEVMYAFHDKDVNNDGTSKGLHVHMAVSYTHLTLPTKLEV